MCNVSDRCSIMHNLTLDSPPLVSVIIPAFNYGRYIHDCLLSVQSQTYAHWECIVVDDGSTDDTASVVASVAEKDMRFRYVRQPNQGQPVARNTGIQHAKGDLFQFLDADDLLEPAKLECQVKCFFAAKEVTVVYGDVRYFTNEETANYFYNRWGNKNEQWMPRFSGTGASAVRHFVAFNPFELGSALFSGALIIAASGFDANLKGVEDYDLCFRLALGGANFKYDPSHNASVLMRHHPDSFSKNEMLMSLQEIRMRKQISRSMPMPYSMLKKDEMARRQKLIRKLQDKIIDAYRSRLPVDKQIVRGVFNISNLEERWYLASRLLKAYINKKD
jgi:glycosyltransferase involved in cell wall biosynthesis